MREYWRVLGLLLVAVLLPAAAVHAQVITGTVKDASGAVLPGVTVELTSPALIEKVRIVVTDGVGQYRVVNLRPGTYGATFTFVGIVHNLFNSNTGTSLNTNYGLDGTTWLRPTAILNARFVQFSVTLNY
jgi:hypothetical protein